LGTFQQLLLTGGFSGCVLWALLATAAYVDGAATLAAKESQIAARAAELSDVKGNYQAAFGQLDEFHALFSNITCEITDIQDSLLRISERNAGPAKRGAAPTGLPHLDPDAGSCRQGGTAPHIAPASPDAAATSEQEALRLRVAQLETELGKLKASHGAFLERSAGIAAQRIGELERTLNSVGLNAKRLADTSEPAPTERYGRGGPFVAATGSADHPPMFSPVALFNTHADRLASLALAVRAMPLAAPLIDYEVTSPFGARNDPINALTGIHEGVDLGAPEGTPVLATGDAVVASAGPRDRYGNMVELDHGMGLHTRYAHLSRILVSAGDKVLRGTPIGLLGSTGRSTGPHLHYEVRMGDQPTNPIKFITAGRDVLKSQ
jgi:murein DD-endopeptidase MepM/ murein hydrolase activator NlpD